MKKKVVKSKKITLETLDAKLEKLAKSTDSKINKLSDLVEFLAVSTAKGFEHMEGKLGKVEESIEKVEVRLETLDQNIQSTRRDVLNVGEKFVTLRTFDELAARVSKIEKSKK